MVVLLAGNLAGRAAAAPFDGTQSVDAYSALAVGSGRSVGLGGAYVGVAEGVAGIPINPASVAHRRRDLSRGWDVGGTLSVSVIGARQDGDNDGGADAGLAQIQLGQLGLGAQAGRFGLGLVARSRLATTPPQDGGSTGIETADVHLAAGWSALRDALIVGVAVDAGQGALVQYGPGGKELSRLRYDSGTVRSGALWRPRALPFRLGAAFDLGGRARARGDRTAFPTAPRAFAFPWNASMGAALWLGPNAARMNEPPAVALVEHPEWSAPPAWEPTRVQPVLLSAQLDVVGPASHAVSVASALAPGEARRSGARASVVPRAGAEWECWPDRLRLRAGSYLEPSRTGAGPRTHGTFGAEVRVRVLSWDFQLSLTGDAARRYRNIGLSLWFWSRLGPSGDLASRSH